MKSDRKHNRLVAIFLGTIGIMAVAAIVYGVVEYRDFAKESATPINISEVLIEEADPTSALLDPQTMIDETSRRRAEVGAPALAMDERLNQSAMQKCQDMVDHAYFSHVNGDGSQGYDLAKRAFGDYYGIYGENLLKEPDAAEVAEVYRRWFESEPHRVAALDADYILSGAANCYSEHIYYFVQHFYRPG
jgi:uncharacterized protein YkwD